MRILLAKCFKPFEPGPTDLMAANLLEEIRGAGHSCELIRIPETEPENLEKLMRTLEIENTDILVSLDGPSHGIRHKTKMLVQLLPGSAGDFDSSVGQPGVVRILLPVPVGNPTGASLSDAEGKTRHFANTGELAQLVLA